MSSPTGKWNKMRPENCILEHPTQVALPTQPLHRSFRIFIQKSDCHENADATSLFWFSQQLPLKSDTISLNLFYYKTLDPY